MSKESGEKKLREFEEQVRPLIEWLNENEHPHTAIIVTPTDAILTENKMSTGFISDYIKD